jgi:hypothetical protein
MTEPEGALLDPAARHRQQASAPKQPVLYDLRWVRTESGLACIDDFRRLH